MNRTMTGLALALHCAGAGAHELTDGLSPVADFVHVLFGLHHAGALLVCGLALGALLSGVAAAGRRRKRNPEA